MDSLLDDFLVEDKAFEDLRCFPRDFLFKDNALVKDKPEPGRAIGEGAEVPILEELNCITGAMLEACTATPFKGSIWALKAGVVKRRDFWIASHTL